MPVAGGDESKIEELKKEKMANYLLTRFRDISDTGEVYVNSYGDGYMIIDGERSITFNSKFDTTVIGENEVAIASGDEWSYEIVSGDKARLKGYLLEKTGEIKLPSTIISKETGKLYTVIELGDAVFSWATKLTKVDFSAANSLQKIGKQAFKNCNKLEINLPTDLPESVTEIGDEAFWGCKLLNGNINQIQSAITKLGKGVFAGCPNLTGEMQAVFNQSFYITDDETPSATEVGEGQFSGFEGLTGPLEIPYYITKINDNAFSKCKGITSLTFEDTIENKSQLTEIGKYAFSDCANIANSLIIPNNVTLVDNYAFYSCLKVSGLSLPSSLERIGEYSFYQLRGMSKTTSKLVIPKGVKSLNLYSFGMCWWHEIEFEGGREENLTFAGNLVFYQNTSLQVLTLSDGIQALGSRAFDGCDVRNLSIPDGMTKIGAQCFYNNKNLNVVSWGTNLQIIEDNAFYGTSISSLPEVSTLTYLGSSTFANCLSLSGLNIIDYLENSKITTVGGYCFLGDSGLTGEFFGTIKNKDDVKGKGKR